MNILMKIKISQNARIVVGILIRRVLISIKLSAKAHRRKKVAQHLIQGRNAWKASKAMIDGLCVRVMHVYQRSTGLRAFVQRSSTGM